MMVRAFREGLGQDLRYKAAISVTVRRQFKTFDEMLEFMKEMGKLEQEGGEEA